MHTYYIHIHGQPDAAILFSGTVDLNLLAIEFEAIAYVQEAGLSGAGWTVRKTINNKSVVCAESR